MFKKWFFILLAVVYLQPGFAFDGTTSLSGRIVDSVSGIAVSYAAVALYKEGGKDAAGGTITDDKGVFTIDGIATGTYSLKIDYIGFKPRTIAGITIKSGDNNLGDLGIAGNTQNLKEVTITGAKSFIENKIDKFVFNVGNDITSAGGTATDVLQKVPQVSVDVDGNVELLGNSNIKVLLNGRPSPQFDNNLADALKVIPASQIDKIEVITSPGAQYDAEGTGGIINIILKESKTKGINGNVNLSAGTRQNGGSFYLHTQNDNLQFNFSGGGNMMLPSSTVTSMNRQTDSAGATQSSLIQNGIGKSGWYVYRGQVGMDWDITKQDHFSTSVNYFFHNNSSNTATDQSQVFYNPASASSLIRNVTNTGGFSGLDWSTNYKKNFSKEGEELNINLHPSWYKSTDGFQQNQQLSAVDAPFSGQNGHNTLNELENYFTTDFTYPFTKDIVLNTGVKSIITRIYSGSDHYDLDSASGAYLLDPFFQNQFNYLRDIYAAYASMSFPLYKNYSVKIGIRDEATIFHRTVTSDSTIPSYNTVVPSAVISRKLDKNQNIKLAYAFRIARPGWWTMNPFIDASDPLNISQGNPALVPEKGHNIDLTYFRSFEHGSSLMVMAFFRYSIQDEQSYVYMLPTLAVGDSLYHNVAVNTNVNAGTQQTTGLNVSGTLKALDEKLELRANINVFYKYIVSEIVAGATSSSINYRTNLNISYKFSPTLVAECYGNFRSTTTEIQGKFPSFSTYSLAIRKLFWDKNGSLAFTTTNPFTPYVVQTTDIAGTDFSLVSQRKILYQSFGLAFTYKFGKLEYHDSKPEGDMGGGEEMH